MGNATSSPPPPRAPWDEEAWRARCADMALRLHTQFTSARSQALYETLGSHVADAAAGGAVFWLGISTAQLFQHAIRVGAATRMASTAIGTVAVASSSVLALHFASFPREIAEDLILQRGRDKANLWTDAPKHVVAKLQTRLQDLPDAPFTVYMAMGVLSFKMLGGRMSSLAPSHYANLGAFHLKKASLPATELYADNIERGIIQQFGRLYGCHTCGVKRGVQYHADHMPPKLVAKELNSAWWRRLFGRDVAFRFYPQCSPCSNQQATVVKMGRSDLKLHLSALRLYHSTGFWLVLLCTGGLYFGGSSFQETADIRPAKQPAEAKHEEDFVLEPSSSDQGLLVSLREREKKVRRQRRAASDDPELVAALDAELRTIEECKKCLKDTLRRQRRR